eukprot:Clim_evm13s55 gene=Clim_evmTU13s55
MTLTKETVHGEVQRAYKRLSSVVQKTRLMPLSTRPQVWLKLESEQISGSFKYRGISNKLRVLAETGYTGDIVTASSGNHGLGFCMAATTLKEFDNMKKICYVPTSCSKTKLEALRLQASQGSNCFVEEYGSEAAVTEGYARARAESEPDGDRCVYVSPYNDLDVIAGQGTIGVEILQQCPDVQRVYVSVGGGGMISGIASYLKVEKPSVKIIGVAPKVNAAMYHCVQKGEIYEVPLEDTLSDGTAGGVEAGTITFDLCRDLVDEWILVPENELEEVLVSLIATERKVFEGAAALTVAAALRDTVEDKGPSVCVMCGGNVDVWVLTRLLEKRYGTTATPT